MPRFSPQFFPSTAVTKWSSGEFGVNGWYPAAPTDVTPTEGDQEVALAWTEGNTHGADITGYKVEKNDGSWSTVTSDTGSGTASYTVTGLTNGTAYTFRVTAINSVGLGETVSSASAASTPRGVPGTPGTLSLAAGAPASSVIDLSWSAPGSTNGGAITGYKIQRSTDGSSWSDVVADTSSTGTTYSNTGLTASTTYHYRVAAINVAGVGGYGNEPNRDSGDPAMTYSVTGSPTERTYGVYKSLHWTGAGNFVVTANPKTLDILIVSGGGGGGGSYYIYGGGGGGGAGGMKEFTSQTVSVGTHTIAIGQGGAGGSAGGGSGTDGGDSSFAISGGSTLSTTGGGAGILGTGRDGGSGAGGQGNTTTLPGSGISGEGNSGGNGVYWGNYPTYGGGGGGKGGTGGSGVSTGGAGGLYGTNYYADGNTSGTTDGVHRFAEGGGGAGSSNSTGSGGTGDGDGGGGAGGLVNAAGFAGNDGAVIIRWIV